MDWTKAKTILIVALIVTNLVLIATYLSQNNRFAGDEKEMQDVTVKLLEEKNIFVEADIPEETHRMAKLTVQYDKMDEAVIREQLAAQEPLPLSEESDKRLMDRAEDFINKCGLMNDNVKFEGIERKGKEIRIIFKNYMNDIAIEDSHIICTVKDGKLVDFDRYWLNPVEVSDIEKEVIPAAAALIKFMTEKTDDDNIYIKDISLVYWLDSNSFNAESPVTDTAFPAWKITYNRDKIQYILAWEQ